MTIQTAERIIHAPPIVAPKMYLCGFPKSGLHLLERMALGMFRPHSVENNWIGTNSWRMEKLNLKKIGRRLATAEHGEYFKGHMAHLPSIEAIMVLLGMGCVFVYRDLRDVLVSQVYHILEGDPEDLHHKGRDDYKKMSREEVYLVCINGINEWGGLFDRFALFAGWFDSEWTMTVAFEELIEIPRAIVSRFFDYAMGIAAQAAGYEKDQIWLDHLSPMRKYVTQAALTEMTFKRTTTFRKGLVGEWRKEFTPRIVDAFKEADKDGWLVRLDYEKDDSWCL